MENEEILLRDTLVKRYDYEFITVYKLYSTRGKYVIKITPSYMHSANTSYSLTKTQFMLDLERLGIKYKQYNIHKEYYLQLPKSEVKNLCGMLMLLPKE